MSLTGSLLYHCNVTLLGNGLLRAMRHRKERALRRPSACGDEHQAPPLATAPRLKELIARHYLKGRYANLRGKVAWVTSGAPVEPLVALGYYVLYPESHGAVCGVRRTAEQLCVHAEEAGYSRDLCSYARTDIGATLSGKTPVGRLPRPDLLLCCTNICQTVLLWYRVLAHHYSVPLVVIDTPFVYDQAPAHALDYVTEQIERGIEVAEQVAGRSLSMAALKRVTRHSADATTLWMQVMERGKAQPTPITAFDEFVHMAPVVEMRGARFTVRYYRALLAELDDRITRGVGALKREKKRLLWDNLPIWSRLRSLCELFARHGAALVASTYTHAWGELADLIDPADPVKSASRVYIHPILNRGTGEKLRTMSRMVESYQADGVVLHSDRSCKPYSIGQMDQRHHLARATGTPALLLEADHNDPRALSDEQINNQLSAFMEALGV